MTTFKTQETVGEIVTAYPALARVFEAFRIDYCCGGKKTLAEVCKEKALNPEALIARLNEAASAKPEADLVDAAAMSLTALADHIESTHHAYLRNELPRLLKMTERVALVHGKNDARLEEVHQTFLDFAKEMADHLTKEERVLFPMIRSLELNDGPVSFHCGSIANPIQQMEVEHNGAGGLLEKLYDLTDRYTPPSWACNTYRAMLDSLARLERDTHMHVHKEDHVLYPRALKREAEIGAGSTGEAR